MRSTSAIALTSNHSPVVSPTLAGLAITSVITRSPTPGATASRIVPRSRHWPETIGWQSLSAPGVPKLPVSNSVSLAWHHWVGASLSVYSGGWAAVSSREWPSAMWS